MWQNFDVFWLENTIIKASELIFWNRYCRKELHQQCKWANCLSSQQSEVRMHCEFRQTELLCIPRNNGLIVIHWCCEKQPICCPCAVTVSQWWHETQRIGGHPGGTPPSTILLLRFSSIQLAMIILKAQPQKLAMYFPVTNNQFIYNTHPSHYRVDTIFQTLIIRTFWFKQT